jgi:hypothetical protein
MAYIRLCCNDNDNETSPFAKPEPRGVVEDKTRIKAKQASHQIKGLAAISAYFPFLDRFTKQQQQQHEQGFHDAGSVHYPHYHGNR